MISPGQMERRSCVRILATVFSAATLMPFSSRNFFAGYEIKSVRISDMIPE
jgi:hypothetical protein